MKYLNLYYEYLKELDYKRNDLGMFLKERENENSYKIIHLTEQKRKIYTWLIVANALLMVFSAFAYAVVKEFFEIKDMLYYLLFAILVNLAIISVILVFNHKIKTLQLEDNSELAYKKKEEYRICCEKIYKLCPLIIVLNENYYELKELSNEARIELFNKKVLNLQKCINFTCKEHPNVQVYKEYLENWIVKNKE